MKTTIDGIDCYGKMAKENNIAVICQDEAYDCIYSDGFNTWQEAVNHLKDLFPNIVELTAI